MARPDVYCFRRLEQRSVVVVVVDSDSVVADGYDVVVAVADADAVDAVVAVVDADVVADADECHNCHCTLYLSRSLPRLATLSHWQSSYC